MFPMNWGKEKYLLVVMYMYFGDFAAGNILLLKNEFDIGSDSTEVSQQKLLTLVAEKLIDINSNINV